MGIVSVLFRCDHCGQETSAPYDPTKPGFRALAGWYMRGHPRDCNLAACSIDCIDAISERSKKNAIVEVDLVPGDESQN